MTKQKRVKACRTKEAQAARKAINRVTVIEDLGLLARVANNRLSKMKALNNAAISNTAWNALSEGFYKLKPSWVRHHILMVGVVYKLKPYQGRKHRGAHCVRADIEKPRQRDYIWLPWTQADNVIACTLEDTDPEKEENALNFEKVMGF